MTATKTWETEPFWGLSYEFDPQWLLTPAQQDLQTKLIDLCATVVAQATRQRRINRFTLLL